MLLCVQLDNTELTMIRFCIGVVLCILAAGVSETASAWNILGFGAAGIAMILWSLPKVTGASGWTE